MRARITLLSQDTRRAEAILKAISPDNVQAPADLKITARRFGRSVKISILSKRLETLIATMDDLLSCVQATERTLVELRVD